MIFHGKREKKPEGFVNPRLLNPTKIATHYYSNWCRLLAMWVCKSWVHNKMDAWNWKWGNPPHGDCPLELGVAYLQTQIVDGNLGVQCNPHKPKSHWSKLSKRAGKPEGKDGDSFSTTDAQWSSAGKCFLSWPCSTKIQPDFGEDG